MEVLVDSLYVIGFKIGNSSAILAQHRSLEVQMPPNEVMTG